MPLQLPVPVLPPGCGFFRRFFTGVSSAGAALSGTSSVGISSAGASAGASYSFRLDEKPDKHSRGRWEPSDFPAHRWMPAQAQDILSDLAHVVLHISFRMDHGLNQAAAIIPPRPSPVCLLPWHWDP